MAGAFFMYYHKIEILRVSEYESTCSLCCSDGWSFRFVFCFLVFFFFASTICSDDVVAFNSSSFDGDSVDDSSSGSSRVSTTPIRLIMGSIVFVTFCPRTFFVSVRIASGTFSEGLLLVIEASCPRVMFTM